MSATSAFLMVISVAAIIAIPSGFYLKKKGYSLLRSIVATFMAASGILGLIYGMLRDYF